MAPRRERIDRVLARQGQSAGRSETQDPLQPRRLGHCVVDFRSLSLPADVSQALAEAFWNHYGVRPPHSAELSWRSLKIFGRFSGETHAVHRLVDINGALLARYIEWLAGQRGSRGQPWSKATRCATFGTLRKLLQWLERCRPGLLTPLEYPYNPFPYRNRDRRRRHKASAQDLRSLLKACERDITQLRESRQHSDGERVAFRDCQDPLQSRGALLSCIDRHFGGVLPSNSALVGGDYRYYVALNKFGGRRHIEACLYPSVHTILPYYLAILIHTAGNSWAIADLSCQCLQAVPLLEDQEFLVWKKPRATRIQRRAFRRDSPLEPPSLIRDLIEWTRRLRPRASTVQRDCLFIFKTPLAIRSLSEVVLFGVIRAFEARHGLQHFAPASIRPSVLTSLYRATGDLKKVQGIANHVQLSTTVGYVEAPEVELQNRVRIATLQRAFLGHIGGTSRPPEHAKGASARSDGRALSPSDAGGPAVSMFGFDCADPLAGIAPGSRAGELCANFLGCFTCPNAVIPRDSRTLAKLIQARDHLRDAAEHLHPMRWRAVYAPPLKILEEEILPRFSERELLQAQELVANLPVLPPMR
jgi:hypothetical protein